MINDFYKGTTLSYIVSMSFDNVVADISNDELTLLIKDSDEIILSSSADMTSSGSIGVAYFDISSSLTNIDVGCHDYELTYHTIDGKDYVILRSTVNVLNRVSGSI